MTAASTPTAASEHDIAVDPAPLHKAGVNPEHIRIGGRQIERLLFLFSGDSYSDRSDIRSGQSPVTAKKALSVVSKPFLLQISRIRKGIASPSQSAGTVRYGMPPSPAAPFHRKAAVGAFGRAPRCCNHADRQIPRFSCQLPFFLSAAAPRSSLQSGCPVPFCACRWYSCGEMPTARLNARENEE